MDDSKHKFTEQELRALYRFLEKEWIPFEDEELHAVVTRIANIVKPIKANEQLDRQRSKTT